MPKDSKSWFITTDAERDVAFEEFKRLQDADRGTPEYERLIEVGVAISEYELFKANGF